MKKPFILLKKPRELLKLLFCIALCVWALTLFYGEDSVLVFAQKDAKNAEGLFRLVKRVADSLCL
ncbi:MAG: hypothetical protein IJO64_03440 [Clostridia bacterium]|nr:hypothetical protein [Clostridia bacterium]MBQ9848096.1 hypothetical protein [Clostridia bacterium]